MSRRFLAIMVAALVLALVAPAMAGSREDARDRTEAMAAPGRALIIDNGETKENLEQVVVNHFGNPNQGQVLIQTWVEPDWTNFAAVDIQGAVQAVKIRRTGAGFAKRVAIRVELYGDNRVLHASSSTVNTGDVNGSASVKTPEAGELTTPGRPCLWWTVAFYTIRWDDDTLSSGRSLEAPGSWLNPMCQLTSAAQRRTR
ncbi:MAG TPA: hypothetical protein VFN05_03345 [Actinomycetes bacterium]|nr:hypothetical protein [Actinomycetes bacterium]